MNKIKSKIFTKNNHFVFVAIAFILLIIVSIVWKVSYAIEVPTNLKQIDQTTGLFANSIKLTWNYSTGATISPNLAYFEIERKLSRELTWTKLTNRTTQFVAPNIYKYIDSNNITVGDSYDYRVQFCMYFQTDAVLSSPNNTSGGIHSSCSGYSNEYSGAIIRVPSTAPLPPKDFKFNADKLAASNPSVELSWIDNSTNETIFNLKRISTTTATPNTSNTVTFLKESATTESTGSTVFISDPNEIAREENYYYQLQACVLSTEDTVAQLCSITVSISVKIPATTVVIPPTTPLAPKDFKFNADKLASSNPSVELSWIDNSTNETIFNLKRISGQNTSEAISFSKDSTTTESTGSTILILDPSDVVREASYYYQLQACAQAETGTVTQSCSVPVSISVKIPAAIVVLSTLPLAPTRVGLRDILNVNSKAIIISWIDNSGGKAKFEVQRKSSKESGYNVEPHSTAVGENFYIDEFKYVTPGVSYDYRVRACIPAVPTGTSPYNCSEYSVEYKGAIIPMASEVFVAAPSGLILNNKPTTSTNGVVQISWTDNSNNESYFKAERRLTPDITVAPISSINVNASSNVAVSNYETGVPRGVEYFYLVKACVSSSTVMLAGGVKEICSRPSEMKSIKIPPIIQEQNVEKENVVTENIITTTIEKISQTIPSVTSTNNLENTTIPKTILETKNQEDISASAINETSVKIQDISLIVDELKVSANYTKDNLINLINESVLNIINTNASNGKQIYTLKIYESRDELIKKVESRFSNLSIITTSDINNLKNEIDKGVENIRILAGESVKDSQLSTINSENIVNELNSLSVVIEQNFQILKDRGGDLLYKDTNKDGISDYDSKFVYNIDPMKPSPVSVYEGREINAAEKILLGFDPSSSTLVKVNIQQPADSVVSVVPSYKVKEVKLTEKKEILIGGQALPNSFITLYIYSTPIIVTIKTDSNGEWQYLLDKELEDGNHTIYTATVNNTGNIVAKSSGYLFTKTAEAITFQDLPIAEASVNVEKPGLLDGVSLYLAVASLVLIIISVIVLIGVISKKNSQNQNPV